MDVVLITHYVYSLLYVADTWDVNIIVEKMFQMFDVADSSAQDIELGQSVYR